MSEYLEAIVDGRNMGRLHYASDRLNFVYDEQWRLDSASFPLSLSMPFAKSSHGDEVVRPFIWGLLPDNSSVLERWGQQFQVSARNPFRLLSHVGEDCAGAVQFVKSERASRFLNGSDSGELNWLDTPELESRIKELIEDHSRTRRIGDGGHFSLAGAQPKTALFRDDKNERWAVPEGTTPTTHILKPNPGDFESYDQNEQFCLKLASEIGLATAESWIQVIGDIPVIIVKRYDRRNWNHQTIRIHQEDMCQALATMPHIKYQNEGGPSARAIFELISNRSSKPREDKSRFLDALIYNWLIGGTDAHAKNYSFLLAGSGQVRLAPLYDVSSCLPYPEIFPIRKMKFAMKIGGDYLIYKVGLPSWQKAAEEWDIPFDQILQQITTQIELIPNALTAVKNQFDNQAGNQSSEFCHRMATAIEERVNRYRDLIQEF